MKGRLNISPARFPWTSSRGRLPRGHFPLLKSETHDISALDCEYVYISDRDLSKPACLTYSMLELLELNVVSQSSFYHFRALRNIRGVLDQSTAAAVTSALISSRLDYAN